MNKSVFDCIKSKLFLKSDNSILDCINIVDGKSGAEVYYIKVLSSRDRLSGPYIVKLIDIKNPWYSHENNEATKSAAIHSSAPHYKNHLVKCIAEEIVGQYHVLIYSYANDSVLSTISLGKIDISEKLEYLESVSYDLLSLFNKDYKTIPVSDDFFTTLLTYRLNDDGNFKKRLNTFVENSTFPAIIINKISYPNPLHYLELLMKWDIPKKLILCKGNVHGDLHQHNVLCTKNTEDITNNKYSIIDYDSYSNSSFLFFDHAYLELSLLLSEVPENDLRLWESILKPLLNCGFMTSMDTTEINKNSILYRNAICKGIAKWYKDSDLKFEDDINIQYNMARVAAGINYFSKSGINDEMLIAKILIYIVINLERLLRQISLSWDPSPSSRLLFEFAKDETTDEIWESCGQFQENYIKILLTDDEYYSIDYQSMEGLTRIDWSFIIDISDLKVAKNFENYFTSIVSGKRNLIRCLPDTETDKKDSEKKNYEPDSCFWLFANRTPEMRSYASLWTQYQKRIKNTVKKIKHFHPLNPFLIVIDCAKGYTFAQKFFTHLFEEENYMPEGTRIINLRKENIFNDDELIDIRAKYKFSSFVGQNLKNIAVAAKMYISDHNSYSSSIVLPSLPHLDGAVTEKELRYYETSVELVYSGIERKSDNIDFGKNFFRGDEIQWHDLAFHIDIPTQEKYEDKLKKIIKAIEEDTQRVRVRRLTHGAGAGGTTLSKRLLWDIKDKFPSMRLKRYTADTARILLEIYQKTGTCLFVTFESGSSIIELSDLKKLMDAVYADNGRALFLEVVRSDRELEDINIPDTTGKPIIALNSILRAPLAEMFLQRFSKMAKEMPNSFERIELLRNITNGKSDEWIEKRCPFFYGFYTFQEEYDLSTVEHTVANCSLQYERDFLSDLAFLTVFSQNLCVRYDELPFRSDKYKSTASPQFLHEAIPDSIRKLVVRREDGWRICHKIIAKKILLYIYSCDNIRDCTYKAAEGYIKRTYDLYGENSLVDSMFRELLIDRTSVDGEKAKFSNVIQSISTLTDKKALFEKMIELYQDNPHYYNHLARLLSYEEPFNYDKAEEYLIKAILIAEEQCIDISIHQTTLGCVYTKKLMSELAKKSKEIKYAKRYNTMSDSIFDIIADVKNLYERAHGVFYEARESTLILDSFSFFPNIKMECDLINRIVSCDKFERNLRQLVENEPSVREFFFEHYGKATQLLAEMKDECGEGDGFFKISKGLIESISKNDIEIEDRLKKYSGNYSNEANFIRRAYAGSIFSNHNCSWDNLKENSLKLINDSMRLNITQSSNTDRTQMDFRFWFETYRRLPEFDASEAIRFINDYKKDGYEKDYLLFIMHFIRYEKNLSSRSDVTSCISRCKAQIPPGINTAAFKDAYSKSSFSCPIIPHSSVERDGDSIVGLRNFTGTVLSVDESRKGTILLDGLQLEVTFLPSITDEKGKERRFTSDDNTDPVEFSLMFSYSGLRAWDVKRLKK